jgi:hypothetical protein
VRLVGRFDCSIRFPPFSMVVLFVSVLSHVTSRMVPFDALPAIGCKPFSGSRSFGSRSL